MSHSLGQIKFKDGKIMYFEYNGTCDVVCTRLYKTKDDVNKHWRKDNNRECLCGNESEDVEIATIYGKGYYWYGKACRKCNAITEGVEPLNSYAGLPEWWIL